MAEAIADLVIRIGTDVEVLKRDMAEASRTTKRTADEISGSLGFVKGAFGALAAGFSLQNVWTTFRAGVTELANLDDAAENAGTSVERLGQLMADLAPSGASMSQVSGMVQQLNRSLLSAEFHTSRAASAFKALNIETKDASGNFKDGTVLLREIAVALDQYEDGTNKSQLATAMLGRSGAQNIAMLKDLARSQGETNRYTSEMAAKAEELDKALNRMQYQFGQWRTSMLSQIIPTMLEFITQLNEGTRAADGFWNAVYRYGLKFNSTDPAKNQADINAEINKTAKEIAGLDAERERISGIRNEGLRTKQFNDLERRANESRAKLEQLNRDWQYFENQRVRNDRKGGPTARELMFGNAGYDAPAQAPRMPDEGAAGKAAREAMQTAMVELNNKRKREVDQYKEYQAEIKYQTEMGLTSEEEALRERQRLEGEHLSKMVGFYNQEILIKERADAKTRDQSAIVQARLERQDLIDQLADIDVRYTRELALAWKRSGDAIQKASLAARRSDTQNLTDLERANEVAARSNEARIKAIVTGKELAEVEREIVIARLEAELALDERPDPNKVQRLQILREELRLYRERQAIDAQISRQSAEKKSSESSTEDALDKFAKDAAKAADTVQDALTNALLRGFEDGKGLAENFRDTLKNMFLTMVLRPVIEPVMKPVADIAGNIVSAVVQAATGGITGSLFGSKAAPIEQRTYPRPRAAGGPVIPGGTYIVGEEGPEVLRMGARGGFITPNRGGGNPVNINQTFNISSGVDAAQAQSIWMASKEAAKAEIADAARRTGRSNY